MLVRLFLFFTLLDHTGAIAQPSSKGTHREIAPIKFPIGAYGKLKTIAMDYQGNLLAGVSWQPEGKDGKKHYAVKKVSPTGNLLQTWTLKDQLGAKMIHGCDDGKVYIAGNGFLAMFDEDGKELKRIDVDEVLNGRPIAAGLYATDQHVFVAYEPSGKGTLRAMESIYRFNRDLTGVKKIIERQYGCCGHIDLEVVDGKLLVAENTRHRVNSFTLDGNPLGRWGSRDRQSIEGFTACCNPCNTDVGSDGNIYTFESGVGRIKRYTPEGKYLGLVGYVDTTKFDRGNRVAAQSCYIPSEVDKDGNRIYVLDIRKHIIRVLERSE